MEKLLEILSLVSNSPLSLFALVILSIAAFITKLQLGKAKKLFARLRDLPERQRLEAIKLEYRTVPKHSTKTFLESKKISFRLAYYVCTLL